MQSVAYHTWGDQVIEQREFVTLILKKSNMMIVDGTIK
jgi:hypothetical protein